MKRLVNLTIELEPEEIPNFEKWLRGQIKVIGFTILPDTKKMFEEDKTFQKLVKAEKDAKKTKAIYINDHNGRYTKKD